MYVIFYKILPNFLFQSRQQTAVHLVASRQTGTATAILRALLQAAGKDIRMKPDGVSEIIFLAIDVKLC